MRRARALNRVAYLLGASCFRLSNGRVPNKKFRHLVLPEKSERRGDIMAFEERNCRNIVRLQVSLAQV